MTGRRQRPGCGADEADEAGSILPLFGLAVVTVALVLVLLADTVAYLVAASRAQAAADAAALAAIVVADPRARAPGDPAAEAGRVAVAAGGRLESCDCPVGATTVDTVVSMPVGAVVVSRLAARRVTAVASAELRPGEPRISTPSGPPFAGGTGAPRAGEVPDAGRELP